MSKNAVYTFAKWQIKKEKTEAVLILLQELSIKSKAEEGNLFYEIYQSNSDTDTLVLFEGYKDESALAEHRNTEHYQILLAGKILPLLEYREITIASELTL